MKTVVKFIKNQVDGHADVYSRTLGKTVFIDRDWIENNPKAEMPRPGEFWVVNIIEEVQARKVKGCFIVVPLERCKDVPSRLAPGLYTKEREGQILRVIPTETLQGRPWILPLDLKQAENDPENPYYAIIVDIDNVGIGFKRKQKMSSKASGNPTKSDKRVRVKSKKKKS